MSVPSQVSIGAVTYTVTEVDRLTDDDAPILGLISYRDATIQLDRGLPDTVKLVTFWHELTHGILHSAGVKHSEGVVQAISYGLVALFAANGWTIVQDDGEGSV